MNWKQPKVFAVKHKDESTRADSRSGGIFTALSDQVLMRKNAIECEVQNISRVSWEIHSKM